MFIFGAAILFEAQSSMDIRQLAKVQRAHWRKFSRHSPIGESAVDFRQWRNSRLRNSYWRSSGYPISSVFKNMFEKKSNLSYSVCATRYVMWLHPHRSSHQVTCIQLHYLSIIKNTKTQFRLNSMLLITYRLPNLTRQLKQAWNWKSESILTQIFLSFKPDYIVLNRSLSFRTFPLYSSVDPGR